MKDRGGGIWRGEGLKGFGLGWRGFGATLEGIGGLAALGVERICSDFQWRGFDVAPPICSASQASAVAWPCGSANGQLLLAPLRLALAQPALHSPTTPSTLRPASVTKRSTPTQPTHSTSLALALRGACAVCEFALARDIWALLRVRPLLNWLRVVLKFFIISPVRYEVLTWRF